MADSLQFQQVTQFPSSNLGLVFVLLRANNCTKVAFTIIIVIIIIIIIIIIITIIIIIIIIETDCVEHAPRLPSERNVT